MSSLILGYCLNHRELRLTNPRMLDPNRTLRIIETNNLQFLYSSEWSYFFFFFYGLTFLRAVNVCPLLIFLFDFSKMGYTWMWQNSKGIMLTYFKTYLNLVWSTIYMWGMTEEETEVQRVGAQLGLPGWWRICLEIQGTWVRSLVSALRSYVPQSNQAQAPQLESLCSETKTWSSQINIKKKKRVGAQLKATRQWAHRVTYPNAVRPDFVF